MELEKNTFSNSQVRSVPTHSNAADYEIDIRAAISNPLSIAEVAVSLTESQKNFCVKEITF